MTQEAKERNWPRIRRKYFEIHFTPRMQKEYDTLQFSGGLSKITINEDKGIYIYGKVNTGKTFLALNILERYMKERYMQGKATKSLFINMNQFFNNIKQTFKDAGEYDLLQSYIHDYDVIIVDDFGLESMTDWRYELTYLLVNGWYEYLKTLIITSNKTISQIEAIMEDARILRRINNMTDPIELTKQYD